jgi:pimeloyl-ACP methyl ester carboxylesterase
MDMFALRGIPIIGHSSGGAAAVYLAATRPEYVSRLVLIEPIIMPAGIPMDEDRRSQMADGARKRRKVWSSTEEMVAAYHTRPTFEHWRDDVLRLYAEEGTFRREDGQIELKCPSEVEAQVFENSASLDIWDVLPRVDCPTLVMKGERTEGFLSMVATGTASACRTHARDGRERGPPVADGAPEAGGYPGVPDGDWKCPPVSQIGSR